MTTQAQPARKALSNTLQLTLTAMFVVLTLVFTLIGFNITGLPGGYIHLGNIPVFLAALLFGRKIAAISGGVGMAMFDLMGGYTPWAPFTLLIGLAMGFLTGLVLEHRKTLPFYLLAMLLAAAVKLVGYYFAEVLLYGSWIMPFTSIPANALQVLVAGVLVLLIHKPLQTATERMLSHK